MLNRFKRRLRRHFIDKGVWPIAFAPYGNNPFEVTPGEVSQDTYLDLGRKARKSIPPEFLQDVEEAFHSLPQENFIHDLALSTQVIVKQSELLYLHGYLLYGALRTYVDERPDQKSFNLLETGTARGFGTVCMAKALADAGASGKITTVDILPSQEAIYWNCIQDLDGPRTRIELLEPWQDLVENHIIFLQGYTNIVLRQLGLPRIHFAFLDSGHEYETLKMEIEYVVKRQQPGDVIICDDYDKTQFPGVVKAVEELLSSNEYVGRLFKGNDERGYMYCRRRNEV